MRSLRRRCAQRLGSRAHFCWHRQRSTTKSAIASDSAFLFSPDIFAGIFRQFDFPPEGMGKSLFGCAVWQSGICPDRAAEKNVLPLFPIEAILKHSDETNGARRVENACFGQTRGACLPSVHFSSGDLFQSFSPVPLGQTQLCAARTGICSPHACLPTRQPARETHYGEQQTRMSGRSPGNLLRVYPHAEACCVNLARTITTPGNTIPSGSRSPPD